MLSWMLLFCLTITTSHAQYWTVTGSLNTARYVHTATLLPNGNVLVAAGGSSGALSSAELYNPTTGVWTVTGSLTYARDGHTATLLPNGNVLVAGGCNDVNCAGYLSSAELYNTTTALWTVTGSLTYAREAHTATQLPNGNVLVAAGTENGLNALYSAELYNPATGGWTVTGSLTYARWWHTATLLPNGNVLVAGGANSNYLNSAELYNAATGVWTVTGSLTYARWWHTATLLPNGNVLVAGGDSTTNVLNRAELYNEATGVWTVTGSLTTAREYHTATLLPNGNVLVAGGEGSSGYLNSAELYNATTGVWTVTGTLTYIRYFHTATLLTNGNVLVAGGEEDDGSVTLNSAEVYNPTNTTATPTPTPTPTLTLTPTATSTSTFSTTSTLTPTATVTPTPTSTPTSTPTPTPSFAAALVCSSLQSNATTGFGSFNVTSANTTATGFCSAGFTGLPSLFCDMNGNWNFTSLLNPCSKVQVAVIGIPTFSPTVVSNLSYVSTGSVSFSSGSLYLGSASSSTGSFFFNQSLIPAITSIPQDLTFSVVFVVSTDCNPCSGGIAFVVQKSASLSSLDVNFPFFSSSIAVTNPYVAVVVNVGTQTLDVYTTTYSTQPEFLTPFNLTGSNIFVWVDYLLDQESPVLQISLNSTGSEKPLQPGISSIFNLTSIDNLGTANVPIYQGFFGFAGNSPQKNRIVSIQSSAPPSCPAIASDPSLGTPSFPSTATDSGAQGVCPVGWQGQPERLCNAQGMWVPFLATDYNCSLISPTPSLMCPSIQASDSSGFASFNATNANTTATGFCQAGSTGSPTLYCGVDGNWNLNSLSGSCVTIYSSSNAGAIAGGIIGGLVGLILVLLLLWFLRSRYWNKKDTNNSDYVKPMIPMVSSESERPASQLSDFSRYSDVTRSRSGTGTSSFLSNRQSDDIYVSFNSLKLGAVLGQGHFGQVFQADYTGAQVAVKKSKGIDEKLILEEARMMKNLPPHPNVLQYFGVSQENGEFMMVTELCDKGNLAQYLRNSKNNLTPQQCRQFCRQIASGMWHISKYGIIHRDLRAENILIRSRGMDLELKVADFGLSRSLQSLNKQTNDSAYYRMTELKPIPVAWTAPEVMNDSLKYVAASDVWSFGVLMWEIYSKGAKPFEGMDLRLLSTFIRDPNRRTVLLDRPENCSDDIFAIMNSCWAFNPQDRPTFEQLFNQLS